MASSILNSHLHKFMNAQTRIYINIRCLKFWKMQKVSILKVILFAFYRFGPSPIHIGDIGFRWHGHCLWIESELKCGNGNYGQQYSTENRIIRRWRVNMSGYVDRSSSIVAVSIESNIIIFKRDSNRIKYRKHNTILR